MKRVGVIVNMNGSNNKHEKEGNNTCEEKSNECENANIIEYREEGNNKKKDESNNERKEENNTTWKRKQHQASKRAVLNMKGSSIKCEKKGVMSEEESNNERKKSNNEHKKESSNNLKWEQHQMWKKTSMLQKEAQKEARAWAETRTHFYFGFRVFKGLMAVPTFFFPSNDLRLKP